MVGIGVDAAVAGWVQNILEQHQKKAAGGLHLQLPPKDIEKGGRVGVAEAPSGDERLTFGEHKGCTFQEVVATDAGYCEWVLRTAREEQGVCPGFWRFADYLRSVPAVLPPTPSQGSSSSPSSPSLAVPETPPEATLFSMPLTPPLLRVPSSRGKKRGRPMPFPLQTLKSSAFLSLYARSSPKPTAHDCVVALRGTKGLEKAAAGLATLPFGDSGALERYVVKLWARLRGTDKDKGGVEFYKLLNDAVISDDPAALRPVMPIARILNRVVVQYSSPHDIVTYRGSRMTAEQFEAIEIGCKYRVAMFVACSLDRSVAERFASDGACVIVELRIQKRCFNAGFLGVEFWKREEREFLMPPYTVVEIDSKSTRGSNWRLVARVAKDNKDHPLDLTSILL